MITPDQIAKFRTDAGLDPTPPATPTNQGGSANTDVISQRKVALGIADQTPVVVPPQNKSFTGLPKAGMGETKPIPDENTISTVDAVKNTAKSLVSGTIESGKDIAAAIGAPALQKQFDALDESDRKYLGTILQLRNKAAENKDATKVAHFQNLIQSYKMTNGETVSNVFPEINKSPEQIIGDFGSLALETLGGGELGTGAAEKAAMIGEKGGLPLAQRFIQGAKNGGKYGTLFGVTGAMQNNANPTDIVKSGVTGGFTGAILGAGTEGIFGKRVSEGVNKAEAKTINSTVGRIIQGEEKDIPAATKALTSIDTNGVKTYKDLFTKLDDRVKALSDAQDNHLFNTKPEIISPDKLTVTTKVGDVKVTHNFVTDAINQLKAFYEKTNDIKGTAGMKTLEDLVNGKPVTAIEAKNAQDILVQEEKRKMDMGTYKLGERKPTGVVDLTGQKREPGINFYTGGDRRNIPGGTKKTPYVPVESFLKSGIDETTKVTERTPINGLTIQEVNDLARLHGQELSGFNANGELASGLTKQAAENTRNGLKATVRQLAGDKGGKASEAIDKSISDTIRTRDLVGEVQSKVNDLQQKIKERTLGEKAGRLFSQVVNTLGLNTPKGAIEYFLGRGTGLKTLNALDLEKGLQEGLKAINSLVNTDTENSFIKAAQNFLKDVAKNTGKKLLDDSRNIPNKQGGFIKIGGKGFAQIPDATKKEMMGVIDYLRVGKEGDSKMESSLSKLAEKYNINQDWSNGKIANAFENLIDKTKTL